MSRTPLEQVRFDLEQERRLRADGVLLPKTEPPPAALIDHLERVCDGQRWPVDRLQWLRRARADLDLLEHQVVTTARSVGIPWSSIGAVDDVTPSAALQRHAALSARLNLPRITTHPRN